MTVTVTYADAELAVRTWARAEPTLVDVVGTRTFFALPDKYLPSVRGAAITVNQIGGVPDGLTALDLPELQFDCWGATKADAAAVRTALVAALHNLTRITVTTTQGPVVLADARVTGSLFSPDDTGDPVFPRYVVTAQIGVLTGL